MRKSVTGGNKIRTSANCLVSSSCLAAPSATASGPRGIYVAFPATTGPNYTAAHNNLITGPGAPYIAGAACYPNWAQLEPSNGGYNWTTIDGANGCLTEWATQGKHVGLILETSKLRLFKYGHASLVYNASGHQQGFPSHRNTHHYSVVVQREIESRGFSIASIPPLLGGDFQGMEKSIESDGEEENGGLRPSPADRLR